MCIRDRYSGFAGARPLALLGYGPELRKGELDVLESEHVAFDLRVHVVVDETEEPVGDVNNSVRGGDVGLGDVRLYTVVTHIHCCHYTQLK